MKGSKHSWDTIHLSSFRWLLQTQESWRASYCYICTGIWELSLQGELNVLKWGQMCHWVEEAYIIWCSKKICKSELLWKILAWPLSKGMSVLAPVTDAFALGDSCCWRSHTETVLHACLLSSCHAAALYPHATTCFSCPAPPPQKKLPSSSSSSSHWSYHFPSRSHNNPSFSLNVTCHTQLFSTAKRAFIEKAWNPFKSILLILKMLKKTPSI